MSVIAPQPKDDYKYIDLIGLFSTVLANGTITIVNDAGADELAIHFESTGAAIDCVFTITFQIPADFKAFAGLADDLEISAYQDGDSGDGEGDIALTVQVLDTLGAVVDDGSIADVALTAAYVILDCPLVTAGAFVAGDYCTVVISVITTGGDVSEGGDDALVVLPKIKYIPQ